MVLVSIFSAVSHADTENVWYMQPIDGSWSATATAVMTNRGPVIITNAHACPKDPYFIIVHKVNGKVTGRIAIKKKLSPIADLCILSSAIVSGYNLAESYDIGQSIVTLGYPNQVFTESPGVIKPNYWPEESPAPGVTPIIELNMSNNVDFGSSGSPVLNDKGQLVGIVSSKSARGNGGYFVPLEFIKDLIESP